MEPSPAASLSAPPEGAAPPERAAPGGLPPDPGCDQRSLLLAALGPSPVDLDTLARATGLGARDIRVLLLELDLAGEIVRHGAHLVSRAVA